jgi:hypothetical protein
MKGMGGEREYRGIERVRGGMKVTRGKGEQASAAKQ